MPHRDFDQINEYLRSQRHLSTERSAKFAVEQEKAREEAQRKAALAHQFLVDTCAVPVPTPLYAVWLGLWLRDGGAVNTMCDTAFSSAIVYHLSGGFGPGIESPRATEHHKWWMPTKWPAGLTIPTAFGANSHHLLVVPSMLENCNLRPTNHDNRAGWEYGHTTVLRIETGLRWSASTNQPESVESYPDVEEYLAQSSSLSAGAIVRNAFLPDTPKSLTV